MFDEDEIEEVERIIWRNMYKNKFYQIGSKDLFQFFHKKNYFKRLHEEGYSNSLASR